LATAIEYVSFAALRGVRSIDSIFHLLARHAPADKLPDQRYRSRVAADRVRPLSHRIFGSGMDFTLSHVSDDFHVLIGQLLAGIPGPADPLRLRGGSGKKRGRQRNRNKPDHHP
jgi:hypothetical protein